jgi:hypothetical protein
MNITSIPANRLPYRMTVIDVSLYFGIIITKTEKVNGQCKKTQRLNAQDVRKKVIANDSYLD